MSAAEDESLHQVVLPVAKPLAATAPRGARARLIEREIPLFGGALFDADR